MSDRRVRPSESGTERETQEGLLDFLRATVLQKASGLTTAQAVSHPVPTTELTVAGLVKHLTGVERFWFSIDFAGLDLPWPWPDDDPHGNFPVGPTETIEDIIAVYGDECEASRRAVAGAGLDSPAKGSGMHFTLRYAVAHMIEETARHCGHLDLLREAIDGVRGE